MLSALNARIEFKFTFRFFILLKCHIILTKDAMQFARFAGILLLYLLKVGGVSPEMQNFVTKIV